MYTAWLTFGDSFKDVYFPDQQNWNIRIVIGQNETGWDCDVYIVARSLENRMYLAPTAPLSWKDGGHREREIKGDTMFMMREAGGGREITVIIKQGAKEWLGFDKYLLSRQRIAIGRIDQADIRDTSALMSSEHGYLELTRAGYAKYQDISRNGTYLNGRKLLGNTARLNFGDVLAFPTGLKIVYLGECIAVNHTLGTQKVRLEQWNAAKAPAQTDHEDREPPSVYVEYQRTPRMLKKCEAEDVEIEAPLPKQAPNQQPLFLQVGPSMTMVLPMLMGSVVASGGSNMLTSGVVMITTSSLLAVMWGFVNRNYRKKQEVVGEERRVGLYQQYIQEMESTLQEMNAREFQRLMDTFPNAVQCAAMPADHTQRLWNRMPTHPDFLTIRIGMGDVDMPCEISVPKQKLSIIDDELRQAPERLKQAYSVVNDAPVTVALRNEAVIGILGGTQAVLFAQGLLMQIAALHSYHDVRIAVLTEEGSASQWAWARWLPHVFATEDRELRMVGNTPDDIHDIVTYLDEVLSIRKNAASDTGGVSSDDASEENGKDAPPLPHYVIFCTHYQILENEPIMRRLLTNNLGMTLVMIGTAMTHLPKESHVVLNMQGNPGYLHSSEGETRRIDFEYPDRGLVKSFSKQLAALRVRDVAENAAIPTLVSFLDMYNVRLVEDLEVWRMWSENRTYDGLKSIIGYRAGSRPFVLDISDADGKHGPHGLIAGTTGSGKSVMLETYILSLALNYSPQQVQFILIDYKGGGMADSFRGLPHVAGVIDNLQSKRVIDRALASLNGELRRRQLLFKATEVNNINNYTRQFGDEEGMALPHLIIIVDEFAELKSEQPEFMAELVSASRIGRSLGVHLILATQKPSNSVSDEIWANSHFHLCLRVQTRQDSMEMLKRPDAAYIKGMGRCFIQIGNDELFEQVQTSYSGLSYKPEEPRAEEMPQLLTTTGRVVRATKKHSSATKKEPEKKEPTQMEAVLKRIMEVAEAHDMMRSRQMWLPELPQHIYLRDIEMFKLASWNKKRYPNPNGGITMLLGLADDVAHQRYLPYIVNLTEMRNLLVVGLSGTGKTTLVQSMVYSLCSVYDPEHLNVYILSLTSQTLGSLSAFPQVGDIAFEDDVVEIKRFLNMLYDEMTRRSDLFAKASTDSFVEYNAAQHKHGKVQEPAIVIFVDRFRQLNEMFGNDDFYMNRIQMLVQEGSGRGIHFIATATEKNEIPSRIRSFFGGVALQLNEKSDYSECIGRRVPYDMPPIASFIGRGMGVMNDQIFEIQMAMGGAQPEHDTDEFIALNDVERYAINCQMPDREPLPDGDRSEQIVAYANRLKKGWRGAIPPGIPRIPQKATWKHLFSLDNFAATQQQPFAVPVGYDMVQGTLATINLENSPSWMVYGPKRSGISNFLKLMARIMVNRNADVYVIGDAGWTVLTKALGISLYSTPEGIVEFLQMFIEQYAKQRKALRDAALENGKAAVRKQAAEFKPCCILVDNAETLLNEFSKEQYRQHLPLVQGLLGEISEKLYYNFSIFMGVSSKERESCMKEPVKKVVAQGRAIALGGKLSEFDPCDVGMALPSRTRSSALPLGQGFVGDNGAAFQIIVPMAEEEE